VGGWKEAFTKTVGDFALKRDCGKEMRDPERGQRGTSAISRKKGEVKQKKKRGETLPC